MAASANSANKKRTGPGGPVPVDFPGHHCPEAANRYGRQQRWPLEVRQVSQIGHQVQIRSSLTVQLPSACPEGFRVTNHHQTIAFSSCKFIINLNKSYNQHCNDECEFSDDVLKRRRYAAVQTRGAENSAAHFVTLLRVQGNLGLDHFVFDLLHGHHGTIQRRLQKQNQRGCVSVSRRQHRRRHILHRHCPKFSHDVRRSRWRGGV